MVSMSHFKKFNEMHGPPSEVETVPPEKLEFYAKRLPADLLEEWRQSGWCAYGDGLLWTVDPAAYEEVLEAWLGPTTGHYAFLRTAFGDIYYWDGAKAYHLDVQEGDISPVPRRMDMLFDGAFCDREYLDDVLQCKLFKKAVAKLGRLKKDECYAFVPPIALGGSGKVDTLKRYKLREQLALLAELTAK